MGKVAKLDLVRLLEVCSGDAKISYLILYLCQPKRATHKPEGLSC